MEAIKTSYANVTLTGEGCFDLPALAVIDKETGMAHYETAWKPTPEELADLMDGGTVYLHTMCPAGRGFPPTLITTRSMVQGSQESKAETARAEERKAREDEWARRRWGAAADPQTMAGRAERVQL